MRRNSQSPIATSHNAAIGYERWAHRGGKSMGDEYNLPGVLKNSRYPSGDLGKFQNGNFPVRIVPRVPSLNGS